MVAVRRMPSFGSTATRRHDDADQHPQLFASASAASTTAAAAATRQPVVKRAIRSAPPSTRVRSAAAAMRRGGVRRSVVADCAHRPDDELRIVDLVRHCAEAFGADGEPKSEFPHCLFMIAEWLTENTELMAQFVSLYEEEFETFGEKICWAVGFWIRSFPIHFDANSQLCRLVERLKKMAAEDGLSETAISELDVSSVPSYAWLRNVSVRNPVSRHISLSFEQWSPEDISTSISHIDYKALSRVVIPEIKKYVKYTKLPQTPILERSIAVFNSLSCWVQCMILSKPTPKERAEVITKFVNVGKHLRKLNNFNTLMAVIGGVTHSNISRLSKTQSALSSETRKDLNALTSMLSNSNNFASYRKALAECDGRFRIPIMGIHLKDLIAWAGSGQSFEKSRTISERRLFQLGNLLSFFLGANRSAHHFPEANMDLINTLKVSLDIRYSEDDIYDLSLKREPRTLLNFQSKSVVFADWASGVCPVPDPDTVNKHISAMVDAVFKHYDHDRDAYISRDEFEQIAGNFPFMDSFVNIDADRDGQISKSEMKNYFLNLSKQSVEFRRGFRHDFHETTFLTPSICSHCNKLLWGLIRQGVKCKDCGLIAHDQCKDVAVAECRRQRHGSGGLSAWLGSPRHQSAPTPTPSVGGSNGGAPNSLTNSPCGSAQSRQKKRLFLGYRGKSRTVSTVSDSPSPEPPHLSSSARSHAAATSRLVAQESTTSTNSSGNGGNGGVLEVVCAGGTSLRSSFHRFLRSSRKNRTTSETVECLRRPNSPDDSVGLAALATEEVFEDEEAESPQPHEPLRRLDKEQRHIRSQPSQRSQKGPNTFR